MDGSKLRRNGGLAATKPCAPVDLWRDETFTTQGESIARFYRRANSPWNSYRKANLILVMAQGLLVCRAAGVGVPSKWCHLINRYTPRNFLKEEILRGISGQPTMATTRSNKIDETVSLCVSLIAVRCPLIPNILVLIPVHQSESKVYFF